MPKDRPCTDRLPIVPMPYPDESLLGLIARCADVNVHSGADWIVDLIDSSPQQLAFDLRGLDKLADLTGLTTKRLRAAAYTRASGRCQMPGIEVPQPFLSVSTRRFCPPCLQEAAYHRMAWDLNLLRVCPAHGLWLRSMCDACGRHMSWRWPSVTMCRCGRNLAEMPAQAAPIDYARLAADLVNAVTDPMTALPGLLASASLAEAWNALLLVGSYIEPDPRESFRDSGEFALAAAGWSVLAGSPGHVWRFIQELDGRRRFAGDRFHNPPAGLPEFGADILAEEPLPPWDRLVELYTRYVLDEGLADDDVRRLRLPPQSYPFPNGDILQAELRHAATIARQRVP